MNKKKILLIVFAVIIVAVGIVAAVVSQKEKEIDPEEFLERFEQAAEEVLGEDIKQVSKTELVATLKVLHIDQIGFSQPLTFSLDQSCFLLKFAE